MQRGEITPNRKKGGLAEQETAYKTNEKNFN